MKARDVMTFPVVSVNSMVKYMDELRLSEPTEENRPVLIESIATMTLHGWAPLVGVRRTDFKYILAPTSELYDLQADPGNDARGLVAGAGGQSHRPVHLHAGTGTCDARARRRHGT